MPPCANYSVDICPAMSRSGKAGGRGHSATGCIIPICGTCIAVRWPVAWQVPQIGMMQPVAEWPLQMISAAILSVLFRVNLPVALFTTLYTNPFTIFPLYVVAYEYGAFVIGHHNGIAPERLHLPDMDWSNWLRILWRAMVMWEWHRRAVKRRREHGTD